jgi:hypothetical protein
MSMMVERLKLSQLVHSSVDLPKHFDKEYRSSVLEKLGNLVV